MSLKTLILLTVLATSAAGHGLVTSPRSRRGYGACSYCLNAGGPASVGRAGGWTPYEPMKGNKRGGFGICGDHAGKNGHMKAGQGARRSSKPIGSYSPGSVANFEFKITANHRGYLEFYLCDVENNPGQDIQFSTFPKDCHYLERVPHSSCESGKDQDCGPIDSRFPGRWMLPCGKGDFGGENGKMAYRLPNKRINVGVVHVYWLVRLWYNLGPLRGFNRMLSKSSLPFNLGSNHFILKFFLPIDVMRTKVGQFLSCT